MNIEQYVTHSFGQPFSKECGMSSYGSDIIGVGLQLLFFCLFNHSGRNLKIKAQTGVTSMKCADFVMCTVNKTQRGMFTSSLHWLLHGELLALLPESATAHEPKYLEFRILISSSFRNVGDFFAGHTVIIISPFYNAKFEKRSQQLVC